MAKRRRRRRSRRRSSGPSPATVLAVSVAAAVLVAAGLVAYSRGVRFSSLGRSAPSASSSRFKGAEGITIPKTSSADFWWLRVTSDEAGVDPTYLPGASPGKRYRRVTIPTDLLFAPDSANLSSSSSTALEAIARQVTSPSLEMAVVCHSSADGPVASRLRISKQRADSLAAAIENELGRQPKSILRIGKGDTVPLPKVSQSTATGRALHRRCEVFVEIG